MGLFRATPAQGSNLPTPLPEEDHQREEETVERVSSKDSAQRFGGGKDTVLGQGQVFEGTLSGEGTVRLDGTLKGDINLQGAVSISVTGALVGTIEASSVFVSGSVEGDITSHGKVRLAYGCKVKGDIKSESLAIEDGASFDGRSSMLAPDAERAAPKSLGASFPPLEELQFGVNYSPEDDEEETGAEKSAAK